MKQLSTLLFVLIIAVAVAACGSSEPAAPAPVTLDYVGYDEFRYDPETATVAAGASVTINFENAGVLEHNWLLAEGGVDPVAVTEADALAGATSGVIGAGETTTFTFTAPEAGTYQILCTVPGHAAGGMQASFTVE